MHLQCLPKKNYGRTGYVDDVYPTLYTWLFVCLFVLYGSTMHPGFRTIIFCLVCGPLVNTMWKKGIGKKKFLKDLCILYHNLFLYGHIEWVKIFKFDYDQGES